MRGLFSKDFVWLLVCFIMFLLLSIIILVGIILSKCFSWFVWWWSDVILLVFIIEIGVELKFFLKVVFMGVIL